MMLIKQFKDIKISLFNLIMILMVIKKLLNKLIFIFKKINQIKMIYNQD